MQLKQAKAAHEMLYSEACDALRTVMVKYNDQTLAGEGIPFIEQVAVMARAVGYCIGAGFPHPDNKDKQAWLDMHKGRALAMACATVNMTKGVDAWDDGTVRGEQKEN